MKSAELPQFQILIVEDEKNIRRSLSVTLEDAGYVVKTADQAVQAIELLNTEGFDLVLLDVRIGEISGIQLFQKMKAEGYSIPVVFMSGNATLSEAVDAIRLGGADFIEKPFSPEKLLLAIERALKLGSLERELQRFRKAALNGHPSQEMLGKSAPIRRLLATIEKVAPTRSKVLILGESGTGKELIARAIHFSSQVSKGPFIKVNCAAIPSELIESELFGHERGAFTGANQLKRGYFEMAHGGTIFLDEIAEMSVSAQAKVLRVLQTQEVMRVGGSQIIRIDVRVIAATHQDLVQAVKEARFREDLYFRLNVVPLFSPPLRDRKEDIPLLAQAFLKEFCRENGVVQKEFSVEAIELLLSYGWPGNVRELKNLTERLSIFAGERVLLSDLPSEIHGVDQAGTLGSPKRNSLKLEDFKRKSEREYIVATLKEARGNITQAAQVLDLERTYLHRKISEHGISKKEYF